MARRDPIGGDLQEQVMRVMWQGQAATVEDVRQALPSKHRGAYTTIQTVLNRLVDRGLLERRKTGKAFAYAAKVTETDYLARSLDRALAGASEDARRAALANLVGSLDAKELSEVNALAEEIADKRKRGR